MDGLGLCLAAVLLLRDRTTESVVAMWDQALNPNRSRFSRQWMLDWAARCQLLWSTPTLEADGTLTEPEAKAGELTFAPQMASIRSDGLLLAHAKWFLDVTAWSKGKAFGNIGNLAYCLVMHLKLEDLESLRPQLETELSLPESDVSAFTLAMELLLGQGVRKDDLLTLCDSVIAMSDAERRVFLLESLRRHGIDPVDLRSRSSRVAFLDLLEGDGPQASLLFVARCYNREFDVGFDLGQLWTVGGELVPTQSRDGLRSFWVEHFAALGLPARHRKE